MKPKPTHGGLRKNAGRKATGHTVVTRSVSMPPDTWKAIDTDRGSHSRGKFIARIHSSWRKSL